MLLIGLARVRWLRAIPELSLCSLGAQTIRVDAPTPPLTGYPGPSSQKRCLGILKCTTEELSGRVA
jgi:hypothetical protein